MSVHFHKDALHDTKELAIHQRYHYKYVSSRRMESREVLSRLKAGSFYRNGSLLASSTLKNVVG